MRKKINLIGQRFGKLVVVQQVLKPISKTGKPSNVRWVCKCDCGQTVTRSSFTLRTAEISTCGCYRKFGKDHKSWRGVGDISQKWFQYHVERAATGYYGCRKHKVVNITIEYVWNLFLKQDRKCAYTRLPLTFPEKSSNAFKGKATASLDRIDSSKGYIEGNVHWVHKKVNLMKNVFTNDEFVALCKLVATFN